MLEYKADPFLFTQRTKFRKVFLIEELCIDNREKELSIFLQDERVRKRIAAKSARPRPLILQNIPFNVPLIALHLAIAERSNSCIELLIDNDYALDSYHEIRRDFFIAPIGQSIKSNNRLAFELLLRKDPSLVRKACFYTKETESESDSRSEIRECCRCYSALYFATYMVS